MIAPTPTPNAFGPTQASRVRTFATFFKSYMSVWTLVVAALPIPVGAFKLIPTFDAQRSYLSVYTSLFCFLSLGFIFFQRHRLGYYMFREAAASPGSTGGFSMPQAVRNIVAALYRGFVEWLPLACIALSVFAVFRYHSIFTDAILIAQAEATADAEKGTLAGAFLIDIAGTNDRARKVALSNLVLFENRNTFEALGSLTIDRTDSGRRETMSPGSMNESYDEAVAKADRYHAFEYHGNVENEANRFLKRTLSSGTHDYAGAINFVGGYAKVPTPDEVLKTKLVPLGSDLMLWYLTIFVAAETAFILMALKEYLQDLAHISDLALMGMDVSKPTDKLPGDAQTGTQEPAHQGVTL